MQQLKHSLIQREEKLKLNLDNKFKDYYNNYKVYNIETSIYELKKDSDNTLVWRATFDLIDPENNSKAISSYIKKLVKVLEKNNFISKK